MSKRTDTDLLSDIREAIRRIQIYLGEISFEAFEDLRHPGEFAKLCNGGYFVEWDCGADLSADTIEARWQVIEDAVGVLTSAQTGMKM